jgi:17beta-estradiol 17-dehydrogenase/3beta-hydroxysteroid 3-dehydrogenase
MVFEKYQKVAIVTGANGGVGFGICQRLLESNGESLTLVMACRNPARANKAKESLLQQFPFAHIDIEIVDVGSTKSVLSFCAAISDK